MNDTMIYGYLSIPLNRKNLIKKIDRGLKHSEIEFSKDSEVEQFQKEFIRDWKEYSKERRIQFCEWISNTTDEGYSYANSKGEHMKDSVRNKAGGIKSKIKTAMEAMFGKKKIGRNDLCPCGSGKKYKKCCLNKEEDQTE